MANVRYIFRMILRTFARILFIFPIKNGRILFLAFEGKMISDNPKCIYDFLEKQNLANRDYIWIYNGSRENINLPENVRIIKRRSFKRFYYLATAQVVVDNYPPSVLIPPRKKQLYIETWHAGGAYKKIGNAYQSKEKTEIKMTNLAMRSIKIFVSSSKKFTETNIEQGYQYKGEILNCGMPRNDVFFDKNTIEAASSKIRNYYSIQGGSIVLFAPTFRGEVRHTQKMDATLDIEKLTVALRTRYGENFYIFVRCHYLDKYNYYFGENVVNASSYPDMQELLCASDLLITDYSSSMWDYALLGRPCLFYTPDIDQYIKDRGFFTPPEQWPGIICRSMDELCKEIENLDKEACAVRAKHHLEFMGSYETGHATEIISNRIISYMNGD